MGVEDNVSDERLAELIIWASSDGYGGMPDTHKALLELQKLRAARIASAPKIKAIVVAAMKSETIRLGHRTQRIADKITEQLATAAVNMSFHDTKLLESICAKVEDSEFSDAERDLLDRILTVNRSKT